MVKYASPTSIGTITMNLFLEVVYTVLRMLYLYVSYIIQVNGKLIL